MRFAAVAIAILSMYPRIAEAKERVCIVLSGLGKELDVRSNTIDDGKKREFLPADSVALAEVQQSFLKKFDVAPTCKDSDVTLTVLATARITIEFPETSFMVADTEGNLRAHHLGARTETGRAFYVSVRLPSHRGTDAGHRLECIAESDKDPAKYCVKQFQDWVKLQKRLVR